jgi:hypothetical protein
MPIQIIPDSEEIILRGPLTHENLCKDIIDGLIRSKAIKMLDENTLSLNEEEQDTLLAHLKYDD